MASSEERVMLPTRKVRQRYGNVCQRTIDRWCGKGILPPPEIINGRRYFDLSEIERVERERLLAAGAKKDPA